MDACTWSVQEVDAPLNGAGYAKPNGHVTVWELIGLVERISVEVPNVLMLAKKFCQFSIKLFVHIMFSRYFQ